MGEGLNLVQSVDLIVFHLSFILISKKQQTLASCKTSWVETGTLWPQLWNAVCIMLLVKCCYM